MLTSLIVPGWFLPVILALTVTAAGAAGPLEKLGLSLFQDELLPADRAFQFQHQAGPTILRLQWQIAEGYYLYRKQFQLKSLTPGVELGPLQLPPGKPKQDPEFGTTEVYYHQVQAQAPIRERPPQASSVTIQVRYQGCAERGICYPPIVKTVNVALPPLAAGSAAGEEAAKPVAEQDRIARAIRTQSFWLTLATFLGFGVLLAFTPCCFPMLPILSGIIVGHGHRITTAKAFFLSLAYVIASALTYAGFGLLAGLFGANLQAAFQNPWVIAIFSGLFVILALSMFGLYELQMPSSWQTRLTRLQSRHGGGMIHAAVMGILSALIVGPCVAAPLAGALIYIGQTGDAGLGGAALFAMGLGMGLPLIAVGTSAGKLLPKAGLWMNAVKATFGVVLLGVAIWMLERILPTSVTLLLWALWLIVPAIYLGATSPLPENASHARRLGKALGVVMLTYGILLLIGLAAGSRDVFQPLKMLAVRAGSQPAAPVFRPVSSVEELNQALNQNRNRWVMLDFYADWCISCKELEHQTFTDPDVARTLSGLLTLKADVTANDPPHQRLLRHFDLIGPPAVLFFSPQGQECRAARLIGYVPPAQFLAHLRHLEQYC
ncbi:MAG TPA: protein-disulfide reductase DsbD [Methylothermaceae bacterium]|nr:protein-disulfide reductase DsbD [Methylothermaceae bacterium]